MTAVRKPRGEYAKTPARRQEILQAGVEVFASAGFNKGSLRDVADRVGLTQAGLLHHFPSKEALLEAVLAWRDDVGRARLGDPLPKGIDFLRSLIDLAGYEEENPDLIELHVILSAEGTSTEHPLHDYFVRRYTYLVNLIHDALKMAEVEGQLRPGVDCTGAARTVVALMDGLQLQWLLDRDSVDLPGDLRRYLQRILAVEF
jgi:AcrR family transcriptional regulator